LDLEIPKDELRAVTDTPTGRKKKKKNKKNVYEDVKEIGDALDQLVAEIANVDAKAETVEDKSFNAKDSPTHPTELSQSEKQSPMSEMSKSDLPMVYRSSDDGDCGGSGGEQNTGKETGSFRAEEVGLRLNDEETAQTVESQGTEAFPRQESIQLVADADDSLSVADGNGEIDCDSGFSGSDDEDLSTRREIRSTKIEEAADSPGTPAPSRRSAKDLAAQYDLQSAQVEEPVLPTFRRSSSLMSVTNDHVLSVVYVSSDNDNGKELDEKMKQIQMMEQELSNLQQSEDQQLLKKTTIQE